MNLQLFINVISKYIIYLYMYDIIYFYKDRLKEFIFVYTFFIK